MNIKKLKADSKILEREVYQINGIKNANSFLKEESSIIKKYNPFYIQCIIKSSDLSNIHIMEAAGFRFVEFRFKKLLDIQSFYRLDALSFYPYTLTLIADEESYNHAAEIVASSQSDDRFSLDPLIPEHLSGKRLLDYFRKSYDNYPGEFIYGLINKNTNELLGVKSGKLDDNKVFFFHTAIKEGLEIERYTYMLDALTISKFEQEGIQVFYSVSTGFNMMELDLHLSGLKYKIVETAVMLRKVYL